MKLTKRKGLVCLLFVATLLLAVYCILLDQKTVDEPLHKRVMHLDAGRLVARSQFDFHHIVEQWVPPGGLKNQNIRRKERLIEDGRVIKEAFEYGESENERVDEVAHSKSKFPASNPLTNVSSRHKSNSGKAKHMNPQSENESLSSTNKTQVDTRVQNSAEKYEHLHLQKSDAGKVHVQSSYYASDMVTQAKESRPAVGSHVHALSYRNGAAVGNQKEYETPSELKMKLDLNNNNQVPNGFKRKSEVGRSPHEQVIVGSNQVQKSENLKAEFAALDKRMESVNSKVKRVARGGNSYAAHTQLEAKVAEFKTAQSSDSKVRVAKVNSQGRTIRVIKHVADSSLKTESKHGIVKRVSNTQAKLNDAPSLLLNTSSYKTNKYSDGGLLENTDFDTDPRYAHLPPAVRKKLAAIRKNRLQRIEFVREVRRRCEGKKYCLQRVSSNERNLHDNCFYQTIKAEKRGIELNPCQCSLMSSTTSSKVINYYSKAPSSQTSAKPPLVALVSLPGSGNTWVRGLLEKATGYCTGAMWCDPVLRGKQFCGEGIRANTLVVKNHDPEIRWEKEKLVNSTGLIKPSFSSAIFVHRDPYEANIAERNRALGYEVYNATKYNLTVAGIGYYNTSAVMNQHTVTFGKEAFGTNPGWNWTIHRQMEIWEAMINHLLVNVSENHPVLLVKYEDLKRDAYGEVERMLTFLDVKFKDDYLKEKLKNGFHAFHRNHTYTFDHYTEEQKVYMNEVINRVSKRLLHHNVDYLHLQKFLRD